MDVLIKLVIAGSDTGPFDLYSEEDGFTTPFETGVSKAALEAGYLSTSVPEYTNIVRVKSTGNCVNYTDITLVNPNELIGCDIKFNLANGALYNYNFETNTATYLTGTPLSPDVAMTDTKLWVFNSSGVIYEYDITLSPWYIQYNRTITGGQPSCAGICAKDNTTLIMGGSTIYEVDITNSVAVKTPLFTLPTGVVTGDIYYNPYTDVYIITYNSGATYYLGQFTSSGTLMNQTILSIGGLPLGLFVYNNELYISANNGGMYLVDSDTLSTTLVKSVSLPSSIYGAAQPPACGYVTLSASTTTTTTTVT